MELPKKVGTMAFVMLLCLCVFQFGSGIPYVGGTKCPKDEHTRNL